MTGYLENNTSLMTDVALNFFVSGFVGASVFSTTGGVIKIAQDYFNYKKQDHTTDQNQIEYVSNMKNRLNKLLVASGGMAAAYAAMYFETCDSTTENTICFSLSSGAIMMTASTIASAMSSCYMAATLD
jgi:hypothetical protein